MNTCLTKSGVRGFSLIEVLVALIVVSVGLLGIAKMQAVAYSTSGVAGKRALAAIEAASLASSMHANRAYWAVSGTAPLSTTIAGSVVTASTDATLVGAPPNCAVAGAPCTPPALAAYDLDFGPTSWAASLQALLGTSDQATIVCTNPPLTQPVTCTVTITWSENQVAINSQEAAAANAAVAANSPAALQLPSYELYIEP